MPHQVKNKLNPTVSNTLLTAPTATVSRGRFSVKIWPMNCFSPKHNGLANRFLRIFKNMDSRNTHTWRRAGQQNQTSQVSCTLVAQGSSSIDQSCYSVRLDSAPNERTAPSGGGSRGLLRLEEFFFRVGCLSTVVGVAKHWRKYSQRSRMGENRAHRNSGWLHRWQVYVPVC